MGESLRKGWHAGWKLAFWLGLLLLLVIGAILALIGNIFILVLGFFLNLCILFLKFFAKFTERLMISTKWASTKVADYTESFYEGVTSTFKKEENYLEEEMSRIFQTGNN